MDPIQVAGQIVQKLETAWNRADGAGFGEPFTEEAEYVDIRGVLHRGRSAIAAGHQAIFNSIYKGSELSYRAFHARAVSDDVIVTNGVSTMKTLNRMMEGRHSISTLLLTRQGETWRIAAFHNALADAGTPKPE